MSTRAPSSETNQLHEAREERVLIAHINSDMVNTAVVVPILGGKKKGGRETERKNLNFNIEQGTKHIHKPQYQKFLTNYIAQA